MTSPQRLLKFITPVTLGLVGISTLWIVGGNLIASALLRDQDQRWQELRQATLRSEANPSALKIEELAKQIGIENLGRFAGGLEDHDLSLEMIQYFKKVTLSVESPPDPMPDSINSYLYNHQEQLDEIRLHLLMEDPPVWPIDNQTWVDYDHAIISPMGVTHLLTILSLDSYFHHERGNDEIAVQSLTASWKLNEHFRHGPESLSQSVSMVFGARQLFLLRHLRQVPPEWKDESSANDLSRSYFAALEFESLLGSQGYLSPWKPGSFAHLPETEKRFYWFTSPHLRLSAHDWSETGQRYFHALADQSLCAMDPEEVEQEFTRELALWNSYRYDRDLSHSGNSFWTRYINYQFSSELTRLVLDIKDHASQTGSWPQLDRVMPSSICGEAGWIYEISEQGVMSLEFSSELEWLKVLIDDSAAEHSDPPLRFKAHLSSVSAGL